MREAHQQIEASQAKIPAPKLQKKPETPTQKSETFKSLQAKTKPA